MNSTGTELAPPSDTAEDLMRKFGITREEAGDGSLDLAWLLAGQGGEAHMYMPATASRSASRPSLAGSTTTSCSGWTGSENDNRDASFEKCLI
jgi:hypothetical protein